MKLKEVETTYICQLNKPQNRKVLEDFRDSGDRSPRKLAQCYKFLVETLAPTPAWGVSGVNKMMNETTASVRATLNKAKNGKTSAPALARKLLSIIDYKGNEEAVNKSGYRVKLDPILTLEELRILEQMN